MHIAYNASIGEVDLKISSFKHKIKSLCLEPLLIQTVCMVLSVPIMMVSVLMLYNVYVVFSSVEEKVFS